MEQGLTRNVWAREFGKLPVKVAKAWGYCQPPESGWPPLSGFLITNVNGGPIRSHHISYPKMYEWLRSQYDLHPDEVLQFYDPTNISSQGDRGDWVVVKGETDFLTLIGKIESLMDAAGDLWDLDDLPCYVGLNIVTGVTQRLIPLNTSYLDAETYRQLGKPVSPDVQPPATPRRVRDHAPAVTDPIETSSAATTPRARRHSNAYYGAQVPRPDEKAVYESVLVPPDRTTDSTEVLDTLLHLPPPGLSPRPRMPDSNPSSRPASALSDVAGTDTTETNITEPDSFFDDPDPTDVPALCDVRVHHDTPAMRAALLSLYKLPADTVFAPDSKFTLHGLRGFAFSSQILATLWALMRPEELPDLLGGFIADGPGTGKSIVTLLICLLGHQLWFRASEVRDDRSGLSGKPCKHLPADASPGADCPVQDEFWKLQCPCVPGGIAERIASALVDGLSLVLVPPHLLSTWAKTAADILVLNPADPYCLQLDVPGLPATSTTPTDQPTIPRLSSQLTLSVTDRRSFRNESKPLLTSQQSEGGKQKKNTQKDAKQDVKKTMRPVCRSQVVLIGAWSGSSLDTIAGHYDPDGRQEPGWHSSVLRWSAVFRSVFFDESHSVPREILQDAAERARRLPRRARRIGL